MQHGDRAKKLERMPLGTLIQLGPSAVVDLTGLRTPCVLIDRFRSGLKRHVLSAAAGPPFRCGGHGRGQKQWSGRCG